MNWKQFLNILFILLLLGSLIVNCILVYYLSRQSSPEVIQIIERDTVTITKDSIITKTLWKTKYDTIFTNIFIHDTDTFEITDTMHIPIEYKQAFFSINKDSIDINADIYFHGFQADIDSAKLRYDFHFTEEIKPVKQKKFGWCLTVGPSFTYGVNFNTAAKTFDTGPSVGFSVVIGPSWIIK